MRSQKRPWRTEDGAIDSLDVDVGAAAAGVGVGGAVGGVLIGSCFREHDDLHLGHREGKTKKRRKIHERSQSGTCCNASLIVESDSPSAVDAVDDAAAVAAFASDNAAAVVVVATASGSVVVAGDEGGTGAVVAAAVVVACHSNRSNAGDNPGEHIGLQSTHHTIEWGGSKRQGRNVHRGSWRQWEKGRRNHKQEQDGGLFDDGSTVASGHCPQGKDRPQCCPLGACNSSLAYETILRGTRRAVGSHLVCSTAWQKVVAVVAAAGVLLQTCPRWKKDIQTSVAVVVGGAGGVGTSRWILSWNFASCQKVIQKSQCDPQLIRSGQWCQPLRDRHGERSRSWDQTKRGRWSGRWRPPS